MYAGNLSLMFAGNALCTKALRSTHEGVDAIADAFHSDGESAGEGTRIHARTARTVSGPCTAPWEMTAVQPTAALPAPSAAQPL